MDPTPLRDVKPGIPPEVEHVVLRALSRDPGRRPTVRELADEFEAAVVATRSADVGRDTPSDEAVSQSENDASTMVMNHPTTVETTADVDADM